MVQGHQVAAASAEDGAAAGDLQREFPFSDADFHDLANFAYDHAGIVLAESKRNLVYSRVSRRLRALRLKTFREYRDYLATHEPELEAFINAISTNLTKFFREAHHFDHFRAQVATPFAQAARRQSGRRLRVWSAGCSTGEEPYTIAIVLKREIHDVGRHDVRILATDIDTEVLARGARGEYAANSIADVPATYREFFRSGGIKSGVATIAMADELRALIAFRRLNLLATWPFSGKFDAVFCRNVMIYFDSATKATLVERFTQCLHPGGWLYIGHSESLIGAHPGLQLVGRTVYRREA